MGRGPAGRCQGTEFLPERRPARGRSLGSITKLEGAGALRAPLPESTLKFNRGAPGHLRRGEEAPRHPGQHRRGRMGEADRHHEGEGRASRILRRPGPLRGGERQAAIEEARAGRADHRGALEHSGRHGPDLPGGRVQAAARKDAGQINTATFWRPRAPASFDWRRTG